MLKGRPINGRDPAAFVLVEVNDPFRAEFIRPPSIVGVIHVTGQDQSFTQLNPLAH